MAEVGDAESVGGKWERMRQEIAEQALAYADARVDFEIYSREHPDSRGRLAKFCTFLGLIDEPGDETSDELHRRVVATHTGFYSRVYDLERLAVTEAGLEVARQINVLRQQSEGGADG